MTDEGAFPGRMGWAGAGGKEVLGRGSYCSAWKGGLVWSAGLYALLRLQGSTGVMGAGGHGALRAVFRERRGGLPWPRGSTGVQRARAYSLSGWAEGGLTEELGRATRGELWVGWGRRGPGREGSVGRTHTGEPLNVGSGPHVGSHLATPSLPQSPAG